MLIAGGGGLEVLPQLLFGTLGGGAGLLFQHPGVEGFGYSAHVFNLFKLVLDVAARGGIFLLRLGRLQRGEHDFVIEGLQHRLHVSRQLTARHVLGAFAGTDHAVEAVVVHQHRVLLVLLDEVELPPFDGAEVTYLTLLLLTQPGTGLAAQEALDQFGVAKHGLVTGVGRKTFV